MKAARRVKSDKGQDNAPPKKKENKKKKASEEPKAEPPPSARAVVKKDKEETKPEETEVVEMEDDRPLIPISERPKSSLEGRTQAAQSITKIGTALLKQIEEKGVLPRRALKNDQKVKTLSWRVELLPYLGYHSLYKKFDKSKPWYMEPNKSLLQYIPDEYVSPERRDTKTNFQLPGHHSFMFGKGIFRPADVTDSMEATLMLVEVDDKLAVEWTAPGDYEPEYVENVIDDLGSLRGDGVIAMWGNGWPTYIPTDKKYMRKIVQAFTAEMGDATVVGELHRPIPGSEVSEASIASTEEPSAAASKPEEKKEVSVAEKKPSRRQTPDLADVMREPVPSPTQLTESLGKLRKLYGEQVRDAKSTKQKAKLAEKMIQLAKTMDESPVDAFALLQVASRLARESGSSNLVIQCIDRRVYKFEVDPYQENVASLLEFLSENSSKGASWIQGKDVLAKRFASVIFASIVENDYLKGSMLARKASDLYRDDNRDMRALFNKMGGVLARSEAAFDEAKEFLVSYRIDPKDQIAAARFGQFLCFFKGDWEQGLNLISLGDNQALAELAKKDLENPAEYKEQIAVADAWMEMGRRASGVYRQGAWNRAAYWYDLALPEMPESLDRMHVEFQLKELESDALGSPVPLCQHLAEQLSVDLEISLFALAAGKAGNRKSDPDDDDDD